MRVGRNRAANAAALAVTGARFVDASMFFLREEKTFASTDGTFTTQPICRAQPTLTVTAVAADFSDGGWTRARFSNLEAMGPPVRVSASETGGSGLAAVVPPVRTRDFTFTRLSDAV